MKTLKKISLIILSLTFMISCGGDDDGPITFSFNYTYSSNPNHDVGTFPLIYDSNRNDIGGSEVARLHDMVKGETRTIDVTINRGGEELIISNFVNGQIKDVRTNAPVFDGDVVTFNSADNVARVSGSSSGGNGIEGSWRQVGVCTNSNGVPNTFTFNSNGTGTVFQSDCNNACAGLGVTTSFNYSVSGSSISVTPTSVSEYCGVQAPVPGPFTLTYSLSGDILTLNGDQWRRN